MDCDLVLFVLSYAPNMHAPNPYRWGILFF